MEGATVSPPTQEGDVKSAEVSDPETEAKQEENNINGPQVSTERSVKADEKQSKTTAKRTKKKKVKGRKGGAGEDEEGGEGEGGEKRAPRQWTQHLAAILATLSSASVGYVDGWSANALPYLSAPHPALGANVSFPPSPLAEALAEGEGRSAYAPDVLTEEQASWLSSLVAVGALAASLPAGALADAAGRKGALMVMTLPSAASWLIIMLGADSVVWLYASRLLAGVVMGVVSVVIPLYNEEIAEVSVRGALGVYQNMMVAVGLLLAYAAGALLPFAGAALLPCVFPLATCLLFAFMPESPVHLLATGRTAKAHAALRFLRGPWRCPEAEAALLQPQVTLLRAAAFSPPPSPPPTAIERVRGWWKRLTRPRGARGKRGLLVAFSLMALRQLSGVNAVAFHAVELLGGEPSTAARSAIALGAVEVAATFCASRVVDRAGRRPLLALSTAGTAVCHGLLALYFVWGCPRVPSSTPPPPSEGVGVGVAGVDLWWAPLVLLCAFNVLYALGLGPLPWLMMAELLPTQDKRWATGLTGFLNWAFMFIVLKLFLVLGRAVGRAWTFAMLGGCCAMGLLFVLLYVPETKGKTLLEIQGEIEGDARGDEAQQAAGDANRSDVTAAAVASPV